MCRLLSDLWPLNNIKVLISTVISAGSKKNRDPSVIFVRAACLAQRVISISRIKNKVSIKLEIAFNYVII